MSNWSFATCRSAPDAAHSYQQLAGYLLFPFIAAQKSGFPPVSRRRLASGTCGPSESPATCRSSPPWCANKAGSRLIREVLAAHSYWRARGFMADLVILNQEGAGYDRPLHFQLQRMLDAHTRDVGTDRPGGVFLRDWYAIPDAQRALILSSSRAVLLAPGGPLARQLPAAREPSPPAMPFVASGGTAEEPSRPLPFLELAYFNGIGGFSQDGREYAIYLGPGTVTPAPWANVMATPDFGVHGHRERPRMHMAGNSQPNRLTTWQNDPVSDPQSEAIYLRDEESGAVWTPTALPIREKDAYRARHGQGYTVFEHNSHAIGQELTVFVPFGEDGPRDPVKIYRLRLRNDSSRKRRLTVTYFAEWVLGAQREQQASHIVTSFRQGIGRAAGASVLDRQHRCNRLRGIHSAQPLPGRATARLFWAATAPPANPAGLESRSSRQCTAAPMPIPPPSCNCP